jgi:hypothetical protein
MYVPLSKKLSRVYQVKSSPNMKASRQKKNAGGSTAGRGW